MSGWRDLADQVRWHEISLVDVMGDDPSTMGDGLDVLIALLQTKVPVREFGHGVETFSAYELARHASDPMSKAAAGLLEAAEAMRKWWKEPAIVFSDDRRDEVLLAKSVLADHEVALDGNFEEMMRDLEPHGELWHALHVLSQDAWLTELEAADFEGEHLREMTISAATQLGRSAEALRKKPLEIPALKQRKADIDHSQGGRTRSEGLRPQREKRLSDMQEVLLGKPGAGISEAARVAAKKNPGTTFEANRQLYYDHKKRERKKL